MRYTAKIFREPQYIPKLTKGKYKYDMPLPLKLNPGDN